MVWALRPQPSSPLPLRRICGRVCQRAVGETMSISNGLHHRHRGNLRSLPVLHFDRLLNLQFAQPTTPPTMTTTTNPTTTLATTPYPLSTTTDLRPAPIPTNTRLLSPPQSDPTAACSISRTLALASSFSTLRASYPLWI